MIASRRIVIYGTSIYILAIESGLASIPEWEVVRVNNHLPGIAERICLLNPDVVIMEKHENNKPLAKELQCLHIPLITLDEAQRSMTILASDQSPKAGIRELEYLIQKMNQNH